MTSHRLGRLMASTTLAVAVATAGGLAQGRGSAAPVAPAAGTPHLLVQVWHVKPDMIALFRDLVSKQLLPAQKNAGLAFRWTWADSPMGGTGFTFVSTQPLANYAQLAAGPAGRRGMGDAAWNEYNIKLRTTLTGTESYMYTMRPDLSIQSGLATAPAFVEVTEWQAFNGKAQDFARVTSSDYIPNYRKGGIKDLWTYVVDYGETPANRFVLVRGMTGYADLDTSALPKAGLAADAIAQMNQRRGETATGMNRRVYQFEPELSFGSPSAATTTR